MKINYDRYPQRSIAVEVFLKNSVSSLKQYSAYIYSLEKHADNIKVSGNIRLDETIVAGPYESRHIEEKVIKTLGVSGSYASVFAYVCKTNCSVI